MKTQEEKQALIAAIEASWISRAKAQGLNPKTAKYKDRECEFFVGSMAALQAMDTECEANRMTILAPPIWTINLMSGRPVVDPERLK